MVTHSDCNACLNPTRVDKSENSCTEGKREKKKGGEEKGSATAICLFNTSIIL